MIGIVIMTLIAFILGLIIVIVDSKINTKSKSEIYLKLLLLSIYFNVWCCCRSKY